jgi:hypothetical protein
MSNLVLYKQTDAPWGSELLGFNTDPSYTIGRYGCLISDLAMLVATATGDHSWNPGKMNDFLKANGGYQPGGGLLIWSKVSELFPFITTGATTTDLAEAENFVAAAEANYAIFEVENGAHYVLAPYTNQIADPLTATLRPVSTYPFNEAHLFTLVVTEPAPPAAPAIPKSGTVTVTAQPALNLRTGPGTNYPIGTGKDANGNTIYSLPPGVSVQYVNVVQGEVIAGNPNWLVTIRGSYISAAGTSYNQ